MIIKVALLIAGIMFIAFVAGVAGGWTISLMETYERKKKRSVDVKTSWDGKRVITLHINTDVTGHPLHMKDIYAAMARWRKEKKNERPLD